MSFREGWKDRVEGRSFPRSYETWNYRRQISYERGRRAAAIVQHQSTIHNLRIHKRPDLAALPRVVCVQLCDEKRF